MEVLEGSLPVPMAPLGAVKRPGGVGIQGFLTGRADAHWTGD